MSLLSPHIAVRLATLFLGTTALTMAAGTEEKRAEASFRFLSFSNLPPLCAKDTHGKPVRLEAYPNFIGHSVRLPTKNPIALNLCDEKGEPLKKGDETAPPVCEFSAIPDTPKQLVLLFGDEKKVMGRVIQDTGNKFPFGRVLAVNLSGTALTMDYGGTSNPVPGTGAALCAVPSKLNGENDVDVRIVTADDAHRCIYSTVWPYHKEVRTLAFIYKDDKGRLLVRTIADADVPELGEVKPEPEKQGGKNRGKETNGKKVKP